MNRRDFLTASSTGIFLGSAGCLGNRVGADGRSYEEVDLNCERFQPYEGPLVVGDSGDNSTLDAIEIEAVDSVPDDAVVIDALEEDLDEHKHLGEALTIAGCTHYIEGVPDEGNDIAVYRVQRDEVREIRELLGESRKTENGWYVGYDADIYRLTHTKGEA